MSSLEEVNEWIHSHCNREIERQLDDKHIEETCMQQPSVRKEKKRITTILKKEILTITEEQCEKATLALLKIPPGSKGVVRGNLFNAIIKEELQKMPFYITHQKEFSLTFETYHPDFLCQERPDWYLYHIPTKHILIGYNQIDLWTGGQQGNRGSKYIMEDRFHETPNKKILSVICKYYQAKSNTSKPFKLFQKGITTNRLCYAGHIEEIVKATFHC